MNITILAISTLIVLIVFGIPVATHPQWFKTVEEEIEEAKREGHIVTAKPVKIEHISKNRRDDIEEPHRYIVTYEYEYNGKTYKKKCKEHEKSQGRAIYIPNGNPKKAFFSDEDHPITLGRLVPILMLVGIAVLYFAITKTMQMSVIIRTAPIGSETMMKTLEQFL